MLLLRAVLKAEDGGSHGLFSQGCPERVYLFIFGEYLVMQGKRPPCCVPNPSKFRTDALAFEIKCILKHIEILFGSEGQVLSPSSWSKGSLGSLSTPALLLLWGIRCLGTCVHGAMSVGSSPLALCGAQLSLAWNLVLLQSLGLWALKDIPGLVCCLGHVDRSHSEGTKWDPL